MNRSVLEKKAGESTNTSILLRYATLPPFLSFFMSVFKRIFLVRFKHTVVSQVGAAQSFVTDYISASLFCHYWTALMRAALRSV
jgi:hypothetical protein